ncbi:MAG: thiol-disulfide oxidoreductase DCC family protein [Solirubrobacterales bacterium]
MPSAKLIYDPDCGFCRWCLGKVLAWDRRRALRPVALGSTEADLLLAEMPADRRLASWHLVDGDGGLHSAGAAFAPLFRMLPAGAPLAAAAERLPSAVDRGYRWVAANRSRFGRLVTAGAKHRADRRIAERLRT